MTSVVLVHGVRTSATMWRRQRERLHERGVAHLAVDLPGHGRRTDEPFSLEGCRAAIQDAVSRLPAPHVLVGLSLGSYVALDWAATTTSPPAALLLASCGTRPRGPGLAAYIAVASLIARLPDAGAGLHTVVARCALGSDADDVMAGGPALAAMVPALRAVGGIDVEAALARLTMPVWFVNGAFDHFRLEEGVMLRAARHATLVVVPGAGHLVALDRPDAFDDVVQDVVAFAAA